jgi:hypothetical protein
MRLETIVFACAVLCGALAGWFVGGMVPEGLRPPPLHKGHFHLARPLDNPLEVTDARWCRLLELYGDFDLSMEVELGPDVDFDVLVRHVEPRFVGEQMRPFQPRFSVLRVTTGKDGPAWRTRDEALVGPRGGGLSLAPGLRATVWIEGRGNRVRANVAGRSTPWFDTDDAYGFTTLVAKGGKAVVWSLDVKNLGMPRSWLWSRAFWCGLGVVFALVVHAIAGAAGRWPRCFVMALFAWLLTRRFDGELGLPDPAALASLLAVATAAALLYLATWRLGLLLVLIGGGVAFAEQRLERNDRVVDELFGAAAGRQVAEAYGQLVGGPRGLQAVGKDGSDVFLLGGKFLYDNAAFGEPHVELLLESRLRSATKLPVRVLCPGTEDADVVQQWRLFSTFYTGFAPKAVVLGIAADEGRENATRPPVTAASLRATLAAAKAHCAQQGAQLVVFVDGRRSRYQRERGLDDALLQEARAAATDGAALVVAEEGDTANVVAQKLADAAVKGLRK